jgi:hypothetical protein
MLFLFFTSFLLVHFSLVLVVHYSLALTFGSAKANPVKFTDFLNQNAQDGWRVVTMDRDIQRMFLFFRREAYLVILERDK